MNFSSYYNGVDARLLEIVRQSGTGANLSIAILWNKHSKSKVYLQEQPSVHNRHAKAMLGNLLALDLAEIWFSYLPVICLFHMLAVERQEPSEKTATIRVILAISGRIAADITSVRLLVTYGLDVQARQIARSISENIDALGRAYLDPDFCEEFVRKQDVEETNQVWHKYIAKGKARKFVYQTIATASGQEYGPTWEQHRTSEETALSAAAHPSFISGFMSLIPDFGEGEDDAAKGAIRMASLRTIRYCNTRCAEHLAFDTVVLRKTEEICLQIPNRIRGASTGYSKRVSLGLRHSILAANSFLWGQKSPTVGDDIELDDLEERNQ